MDPERAFGKGPALSEGQRLASAKARVAAALKGEARGIELTYSNFSFFDTRFLSQHLHFPPPQPRYPGGQGAAREKSSQTSDFRSFPATRESKQQQPLVARKTAHDRSPAQVQQCSEFSECMGPRLHRAESRARSCDAPRPQALCGAPVLLPPPTVRCSHKRW